MRRYVAGLQLTFTSGQSGAGTRVRMRGNNSPGLSVPLVFVDGLRVSGARGVGQDVSVLDLLNPDDVRWIEVFRGPAATTLYGTDAAGGLIRVYTGQGGDAGTRAPATDVRASCTP